MGKTLKKLILCVLASTLILTQTAPGFAGGDKPDITASGAIVYCQNTGETVYSKNSRKKLEPFSVTKLMTVLLAVQNLPLDKEVTVSAEAASQPEASMDLKEGEVLTVRDLIYGALLPSGNDAAWALGEAVSGSMDDFVDLMNKTAENIGCTGTHFTNPSGMRAKQHYTTAYDMMLIVKVAFSNDVICQAAGAKTYKMEATNKHKARTLKTHISFIEDEDSGVYAAKSGYWDDQNCSMALGYKENGLSLLIVVLGDTKDDRTGDIEKLIAYAQENVEGVKVIGKDKEKGKVRIKHGEKTTLKAYTAEEGYAYLPKEASVSLIREKVVMRNDIEAPVKAGTVVGRMEIYAADDLVNEVDLIIKEDVDEGWFPSYVGISNFATVIICAVLLLFLLICIWIAAVRARVRRRRREQRKKKIMAIAMEELRREQDYRERDWHF